MKKIKIIMSVVLVFLIMLFACIPKASAYQNYTSLNNVETVLYDTDHELLVHNSIDTQAYGFADLWLFYTYRLIDNLTYIYIYGYEYKANGYTYSDRSDIYIPVEIDLLNYIDSISLDTDYINRMKHTLDTYMVYLGISFIVEQDTPNLVYPTLSFHDIDYNWFHVDYDLEPFTIDNVFIDSFADDIPLELVHSNMVYETYLFSKYQLDGNSLAQLDNISITDWLVNSVGGLFDTPLLGGVSIGDILMFVLAIGLLFLFLRFFAGG